MTRPNLRRRICLSIVVATGFFLFRGGVVAAIALERVQLWDGISCFNGDAARLLSESAGHGECNFLFYDISDVVVKTHYASDWNCRFLFLWDKTSGQITILHSEGAADEPDYVTLNSRGNDLCGRFVASDIAVVGHVDPLKSDFANQTIRWYVYIPDSRTGKIYCFIYITHQYDVRGHRIDDSGAWVESVVGGGGVVERPISMAAFTDVVGADDNAFAILDYFDGAIKIVTFDNALLRSISPESLGFSDVTFQMVEATKRSDGHYLAILADTSDHSEVILLRSLSGRTFSEYVVEGRWAVGDAVDCSIDDTAGLWVLKSDGTAFVYYWDGLVQNQGFSSAVSRSPQCIALNGQNIFPVATYGDDTGLEAFRLSSNFFLSSAGLLDEYFTEYDDIVCQYGIQDAGTYSLRLKYFNTTTGQYSYYVARDADFAVGPHQVTFNLSQVFGVDGSGNTHGCIQLTQYSGGVVVNRFETEEFDLYSTPSAEILSPEADTVFNASGSKAAVYFNLYYGSWEVDYAHVLLLDYYSGEEITRVTIENPDNGEHYVKMALPANETCFSHVYLLRIRIEYRGLSTETSGKRIVVSGVDCDTPPDDEIFDPPFITKEGGDYSEGWPTFFFAGGGGNCVLLSSPDRVIREVRIFDVRGRLVAQAENVHRGATGKGSLELRVPAGVYFARIRALSGEEANKKFVILH